MSLPALPTRPSASADLRSMRDMRPLAGVRGMGAFELETPNAAETTRRRGGVPATGLPARAGVEQSGVRQRVASKFEHRRDVALMQRHLGAGAHTAPAGGVS
jgi:hypothetical protein